MRSRPSSALLLQLAAALLAAAIALALGLVRPDVVVAAGGGNSHAKPADPPKGKGGGKGQGGGKSQGGGTSQGGGSDPGLIGSAASGDDITYGSVNPLSIENPLCDQHLKPREKANCELTGSPSTRYPTSNYGLEVHADDTGSVHDNIVGAFQTMLASVANAIWMAALFVLNLVLTLLSWAFTLNPFGDGKTMGAIGDGLERFYRVFTSPWLVFAMAALGAWGVWKGIVRREVAASIAGMAVSVVMMIGALIVLHEPKATVGTAAGYVNKAAQSLIGAPLEGSLKDPEGSYAAATSETWNAMTVPGFAALNFTDVGWALEKPEDDILEFANRYACFDYAYLPAGDKALWTAIAASGDEGCSDQLLKQIPKPHTNAEIWLRNSTGSSVRQKLWDELTDEDSPYRSYMSIQGGGGSWTRLPLVVVIVLGLLGGICLLAWLAIRLFVQTAVAFVLLLAAPLVLFMPAFGERGRASFVFWGTTLAGAIVSKLVYAAMLAVVLFATNTIARLADGSGGLGSITAFLIMAGLWWAVFLKRDELLNFVSIPGGESSGRSTLDRLFHGARLAGHGSGLVRGLAGGAAGAAAGGFLGSKLAEGADAPRAHKSLDQRAAQRLDGEYEDARRTLSEHEQKQARLEGLDQEEAQTRERLAELSGAAGASAAAAAGAGAEAAATRGGDHYEGRSSDVADERRRAEERLGEIDNERAELRRDVLANEGRVAAAAAIVQRADAREQKQGSRWNERQLGRAREELRRELDRSPTSEAHAWRLGMSREEYRSLEGAERHDAHEKVRAQISADKAALGTISDRPAGAVAASRPGASVPAKLVAQAQRAKGAREAQGPPAADPPRTLRGAAIAGVTRRVQGPPPAGPDPAPRHRGEPVLGETMPRRRFERDRSRRRGLSR
jgi:hypothetical protein